DLLRTIAIVWVMLFHSFIVGGLGPNFEWLSRFGWAGVDIFFVLGIGLRGGVWLHDSAIDPRRNWFIEDIYYPSWMRLDGLLVGVMLAALQVYRPHLWARLQARSNACLLGGVTVSCLAFWLFRDRTGLLANAIGWPLLSFGFGLLVFAAADCRSLVGRWRIP